ncbi:MAG: hypothetical protein HY474_01735 [Candidatus Sungbacteria bacterium]|uniref:Uncharacterized protein n=1 Tax=Candidatus Sungiibacteriota bacterium TaxID=2750080 RepID=A0A932YVR1_9BACT|nr:hypothetical protein [Candidatus Sungbacteria bacterium]
MAVFPLLCFALLLMVLPSDAAAYLDPGTGSFILQIILASLFGASFAVKNFWRRVKSFLFDRVWRRGGSNQA